MLLLISQRRENNKHGDPIDVLEGGYTHYFEQSNAILLPLPNLPQTVSRYFKELQPAGLILSGGNDIDPALYGGKPYAEMSISHERDETERTALEFAVSKRLPVLGICRGMQFINVFFRGKLSKNMSAINHVAATHPLTIQEERAKKLLGDKITVNSFHGQGISADDLSNQLKIFAVSDDGRVEGVYHPDLPIGAIMWHPERVSPDAETNRKIVEAFLNRKLYWEI